MLHKCVNSDIYQYMLVLTWWTKIILMHKIGCSSLPPLHYWFHAKTESFFRSQEVFFYAWSNALCQAGNHQDWKAHIIVMDIMYILEFQIQLQLQKLSQIIHIHSLFEDGLDQRIPWPCLFQHRYSFRWIPTHPFFTLFKEFLQISVQTLRFLIFVSHSNILSLQRVL